MVEIAEDDFLPLEHFRLKWRWTDVQWNLIPETDLSQIKPLSEAKANELFESTVGWVKGDSLSDALFDKVSQFSDRGEANPKATQDWLQQKSIDSKELVVVSWDRQLAVFTNWGVFYNYWDDFCYPVSHNVLIWPLSEQWALFYHHEEFLFFGIKKN